ncbi:aminotransferase class III-fold pyridoxal phosphate-dependent enzyme [Actinoplanes flavus]|uniref:Aminotransferase class III-fold pyridoxal phosphate-dependent enzyme n=1 Tax=Actinoplanes flavus TaxID=2820290 RepID=A0ABS3USH5_9ACTN|nr:aminotransferase class III-fold pyridoxal phosphate-dependent enzyme [Actinoplanes flavus]MBO3741529.1 aminotransferase class III-fold pyridoxal phosphate-dependent enzyme [Actinoplanes flavus]
MLAHAGRGATLHVTTDGHPAQLVDLCSMTENTILGLNDPWVKLKQISYLLSERPHYVTIRMGSDLYYRVANRVLRCFDPAGRGEYVVNLRECTGSGAVEAALHAAWKAAAVQPGRRKLASFKGGFHGSNLGGILASEHQAHRGSGRVLVDRADNVEFLPVPRADDDGRLTEETLATLAALDRDGDQYFAVILEPIPWRNAVHVVPTEFLRRLREICTRKSICLIFDELQNGFGYTGTISYSEICGVRPDIAVMGKGLTSGHGALAIVVAARALKEFAAPFGFKSNSGSMLSLVAVDAVLDRLLGMDPAEAPTLPAWLPPRLADELRTGLLESVYPRAVGMIDEMLARLRQRFPELAGPEKGLGLMRGLVMLGPDRRPSELRAADAARMCLANGVHVRQADTAIFIKPCMVISQSEIDQAYGALTRTFEQIERADR